jgi:hypothetical protein
MGLGRRTYGEAMLLTTGGLRADFMSESAIDLRVPRNTTLVITARAARELTSSSTKGQLVTITSFGPRLSKIHRIKLSRSSRCSGPYRLLKQHILSVRTSR